MNPVSLFCNSVLLTFLDLTVSNVQFPAFITSLLALITMQKHTNKVRKMYQSSRFNYKKMPFQELIFFSCILAVHVSTGIYICAC